MKQLTQEQLEQVYREHPEWLVNLEVGKWYKVLDNDWLLFCVTELLGAKYARGYGWDESGIWCDAENTTWGTYNLIPATDEDVEAALIAEARKRGFKSNQIKMIGDTLVIGVGDKWKVIFIDGKWATVITPASTLAEDIQALKDKYPNYNWTIIAEEKQ